MEILKESHLNQKKPRHSTSGFTLRRNTNLRTSSPGRPRSFGFLARWPGWRYPSPQFRWQLPTIPRYRVPQSERRWWHNTPQSNPPSCYGDSTPCWRYHLHKGKGVDACYRRGLVNDKTRGMFNLSKVWRWKYETWKWWKNSVYIMDPFLSFSMVHIEILIMNHCANIMFYISLLSFFTSFCLQL